MDDRPQVTPPPALAGCVRTWLRDEEAAGSNPATPTQLTGHSLPGDVAFLYAVQQQVQQRPTPLTVLPTPVSSVMGAGEEVRSRILRALLRAVVGAARIRIPVCG